MRGALFPVEQLARNAAVLRYPCRDCTGRVGEQRVHRGDRVARVADQVGAGFRLGSSKRHSVLRQGRPHDRNVRLTHCNTKLVRRTRGRKTSSLSAALVGARSKLFPKYSLPVLNHSGLAWVRILASPECPMRRFRFGSDECPLIPLTRPPVRAHAPDRAFALSR